MSQRPVKSTSPPVSSVRSAEGSSSSELSPPPSLDTVGRTTATTMAVGLGEGRGVGQGVAGAPGEAEGEAEGETAGDGLGEGGGVGRGRGVAATTRGAGDTGR